jgi:competence protein ComEC
VQRVAGRLRDGLRTAADPLPADERGLLPGLVDGDTSRLPDALRDDFRTAGLTHLVAVSGSNVAIVGIAALALARAVGLGLRGRAATAVLAIAAFVVLARPTPSVLRAALMGGIGLLALAGGRRRIGLGTLAATVLVLVLVDPALATSDGFALSVVATAGLIVLAPRIRERIAALAPAWPRWVGEALAVAIAAQLVTAPYIACRFGRLSLVAIPANIAAAPAVPPATILGVLAAALAPLALPVAEFVAWLAGAPTAWLALVAHTAAGAPNAAVGWPTGLMGCSLVLATVAGLRVVRLHRTFRRPVVAAVVGLIVGHLVITAVPPAWPPRHWAFVVCDVGQGDGLVLRASPTDAVVIDTGPDPALMRRCLHQLGVRHVRVLILSHFHADHVEGLPAVLDGWPVGEVDVGQLAEPPEEVSRVLDWAAAAHVPVRATAVGDERRVGDVQWRVIGPLVAMHGTDSDPNNNSLVLVVDVGGLTVLLTGDVEQPAQNALVHAGVEPHVDVLKIPHHGSANQSPDFLTGAAAPIAIASVGAGNSYGHPSPLTLTTLQRSGARTFRTDADGSVAVLRDAGGVRVVTSGGRGGLPPTSGGSGGAASALNVALSPSLLTPGVPRWARGGRNPSVDPRRGGRDRARRARRRRGDRCRTRGPPRG